jgi:hypothetical protein
MVDESCFTPFKHRSQNFGLYTSAQGQFVDAIGMVLVEPREVSCLKRRILNAKHAEFAVWAASQNDRVSPYDRIGS